MIDVRLIVFLQGFVNGRERMSEECGFKPEDRE
jgi:hypothetical protein